MNQDQLIELIYDAIFDNGAACDLAEVIAEDMHAETNWMLIGVNETKSPSAMCIYGIDDDIAQAYQETYHRYDPWLSMVNRCPVNTPVSLTRWVSTPQFVNSRVYQELVRGRVDIMHCMGFVFREGGSHSVFALQRGKRGLPFDEQDEKRLTPYLTHLRRFVTATIRRATIIPLDLDTLLTRPDPVIIVDQYSYPAHCSAEGAALLDLGTVLGRTHSGRLFALDRDLSLETAVRLAALKGVPTVRHIDPPCGAHIVAVDPCPALARHAIITVRNLESHARRKVDGAGLRFEFTGAERRLVTSLVIGQTLEEYSLCNGVSISTARSQLHSVFGKTGARRQSELMSVVLATPTLGQSLPAASGDGQPDDRPGRETSLGVLDDLQSNGSTD